MAAVTVGGAFLSASLQVLFDKLSSPTLHEFGSLWGVEHELSRLRRTLLKILSVVDDSEMREIRDRSTKLWLMELRDVAYDADDILDEFEAEALRQQVDIASQVSYLSSLSPNQVIFRREISKKMDMIRGRLDDVARDREGLKLGDTAKAIEKLESSSLVDMSTIFGREQDSKNIMEILLSYEANQPSTDRNVSAFVITGMGGIGKTTLAKLIYNDERIDGHFQLKIWVHVSRDFSVRRITGEILESASNGRHCDMKNWNMVEEIVKKEVQGKRLLLVLDDVWNEDRCQWEQLCLPLMHAGRGSKILITAQNKNVARVMNTMALYCLECLSEEDCWQIFKKNAFTKGICDEHPKLAEIGKKIVRKAKGLPLAAKTLGGLVHGELDEYRWRLVLESEIWEMQSNGSDIMTALGLSYQNLPSHLKQCFAYCSLFPKDYEFEKKKLIQSWIAQGFIRPHRRRLLEEVGSDYFDELLGRSFFQQFEDTYLMHDVIHDLARSVSIDECFKAEGGELQKVPERIRHLSVATDNIEPNTFKDLHRFKSLRTLLFFHENKRGLGIIPEDLFIKLRYMRVLDLSCNNIKDLPNSIGNLKHLRYLDVSHNSMEQLPESICNLHNLQTLKLEACPLRVLPKGMTNLINLRHLKVNNQLVSSIGRIGRLTNLQELVVFTVQKEEGHKIGELKYMTKLQKIHISHLENIICVEDAVGAMLNNKKYLRMLTMEWSSSRETNLTELEGKVLEDLQPHPNLKELNIWYTAGVSTPSWLSNQFLSNLETVRLRNCKNWELLPSLGQLQFLKYLEISGMNRVKQVDHHFYGSNTAGFPSLLELQFFDMPEWEDWSSVQEGKLFPRLQELLIFNCPKLLELPQLPYTLARLWIRQVGLRKLPDLQVPHCIENDSCSPSPSSLSTLEITECPNLTSLREGLLSYQLTALESLIITDCPALTYSPEEGGFLALVPLKFLTIENCPKLTALLEDGPLSLLAHLKIGGCPDLRIGCLQNLTSLNSLSISDCPTIVCLPEEALGNLTALEELIISGCRQLAMLQFQALVSIKRLTIENCPMVKSSSLLPSSTLEYLEINNTLEITGLLQNLICLLTLRIHNCPQIISFGREEEELQKLTSLQSLHIDDCVNLQSLPEALHHLTSLERLYLQNCPQIKSLPDSGLPSSLAVLDIRQCPILEDRCQRGGPDWPKIACIPNLHVTSGIKSRATNATDERMDWLASLAEIGAYGGLLY